MLILILDCIKIFLVLATVSISQDCTLDQNLFGSSISWLLWPRADKQPLREAIVGQPQIVNCARMAGMSRMPVLPQRLLHVCLEQCCSKCVLPVMCWMEVQGGKVAMPMVGNMLCVCMCAALAAAREQGLGS